MGFCSRERSGLEIRFGSLEYIDASPTVVIDEAAKKSTSRERSKLVAKPEETPTFKGWISKRINKGDK